MAHKLVVVESPTKARTIRGFLPGGYVVASSMGHIRDLPNSADETPKAIKGKSWAQFAVDVEGDFEPYYIIPKDKVKVVKELKAALGDADELLLATDEDREGESISWHLVEVLKPKVPTRRMVFHEITKEAIREALAKTRDIDLQLVRAQETRRVLDRLAGYSISPLLWKKIGGNLSAGRVQSVAVRLLVQRERERRAFRRGTYWNLRADLAKNGSEFEATLHAVAGKRIATGRDFDEQTGALSAGADVRLLDEAEAGALRARLERVPWVVQATEEKPLVRKPAPPFITSTLQQEANRKLNLSAKDTMRVAQDLYQNGFITYMRTDSTALSTQAIEAARTWVSQMYGREFLSPQPRQYETHAKGAQEAHEAIRPAGSRFRSPDETGLSGIERKLYELIWMRTIASQMADSQQTQITVTIAAADAEFRASGKRIDFAGFLRAYVEGFDDPEAALADQEIVLPPMTRGDALVLRKLDAVGHETKPPARYTEATLIRALEADGIGRPSTYASILSTILDRGYARVDKKALVPTLRAFAVTQLLERHFSDLVDTGFTAEMEAVLDRIAAGQADALPYLREFYKGEKGLEKTIERESASLATEDARTITLDGLKAKIRIGRFGPWAEIETTDGLKTVNIPENVGPADIDDEMLARLAEQKSASAKPIGRHPATGEPIYVLSGRFGPFVQLGEQSDDKKAPKPKRASLPKGLTIEQVTLDMAVALLSLPRQLGDHPDGGTVQVGQGRFGPFVVHTRPDGTKEYRSLKAGDDVLTISLSRAIELLREPKGRARGVAAAKKPPLRSLGPHPDDGQPIEVFDGRFGPYVKHGSINVTLPKTESPEALTIERALELLAAKAARGGTRKRRRS